MHRYTVHERLPAFVRPAYRKWLHLVHPELSWKHWKKRRKATDAFVEQFFDDRDEYETLREEFYEGRIREICGRAMEETDGDDRIFDAHRDECAKLYALVRRQRPERIVETGVYSGVSTASILLGLERNGSGTLYSLDPGQEVVRGSNGSRRETQFYERGRPSCAEPGSHLLPEGKSPGWIIPSDLRDRWELTVGRSRRELPSLLSDIGEIDMFLQDSESSTTGMLFEFELAWAWLRPGGILLSPHVDHNHALQTFTSERECTHGLFSHEPRRYVDDPSVYERPASCAYVVKVEAS